jgi:Cu-Zn family superoxide dismutase
MSRFGILFFFVASSVAFAANSVKPVSVEIRNDQGEKIGTAVLTDLGDHEIRVSIQASKLTPGQHGIHFHEFGKCEGPDFKTAGGHLNPAKKEHGLKNVLGPHAGDLPNLDVGSDGTVKAEMTSHQASLRPGAASLLKAGGTALVIHAKADDQKTSPSGNSGDRIACGVIGQ